MMNITNYVIKDVRGFLNIDKESDVFDSEIIPHITAALGKLSQAGVSASKIVDAQTMWSDVVATDMVDNQEVFSMFPLYVMLSTKIIFDPPPPSTVEYYDKMLNDLLWRLRLVYDTKEVNTDESQTR